MMCKTEKETNCDIRTIETMLQRSQRVNAVFLDKENRTRVTLIRKKEDTSLSQVNVNHCHCFEPQATQKVLVMKVEVQVTLGQIHITCPDSRKTRS